MPTSIRAQVAELHRLAASRTAATVEVQVDLVTADTREEALALLALPATPPPNAARIRLVPVHHTAAEYLAGITAQ
jgi:hypothetical protein